MNTNPVNRTIRRFGERVIGAGADHEITTSLYDPIEVA